MGALSPSDVRRAIASAAMLTSDNDGVALNAGRALCRIIERKGLDPAKLIAAAIAADEQPQPQAAPAAPRRHVPRSYAPALRPHQLSARMALAYPELLTGWEVEFLNGVASSPTLSERQRDKLHSIAAKVERGRI